MDSEKAEGKFMQTETETISAYFESYVESLDVPTIDDCRVFLRNHNAHYPGRDIWRWSRSCICTAAIRKPNKTSHSSTLHGCDKEAKTKPQLHTTPTSSWIVQLIVDLSYSCINNYRSGNIVLYSYNC